MPSPDATDAPIDDLQCARCRADLDDADRDGQCPECQVPVALSIKVHHARLAVVLRVCRTCGYRLRGLPDAGSCPECGRTYTRQSLMHRYVGYLEDSWLQIFQVPLIALCGLAVGRALFRAGHLPAGTLTIVVVLVSCTAWAWQLSGRMAAWRYLLRLEATAQGHGPDVSARYKARLALVLFAVQLALIAAPWLTRLGRSLGLL